jgi:hypothetical protein
MSSIEIPEPIRIIISNEFNLGSKSLASVRNAIAGPEGIEISSRLGELENLSRAEHEVIIAKIREEQGRRSEAAMFFNARKADADPKYWAKSPIWTIEEAVAISFLKSPEVVNSKTMAPYVKTSAFARAYSRRMELATRSVQTGKLSAVVEPEAFLKWADRYEEAIPDVLRAAVAKFAANDAEAPLSEINRPEGPKSPPLQVPKEKPLQRRQEEAIVDWLKANYDDIKLLPKPASGKPGPPAAAWKALQKTAELFKTKGIFEKAWARLLDFKEIQYGG